MSLPWLPLLGKSQCVMTSSWMLLCVVLVCVVRLQAYSWQQDDTWDRELTENSMIGGYGGDEKTKRFIVIPSSSGGRGSNVKSIVHGVYSGSRASKGSKYSGANGSGAYSKSAGGSGAAAGVAAGAAGGAAGANMWRNMYRSSMSDRRKHKLPIFYPMPLPGRARFIRAAGLNN